MSSTDTSTKNFLGIPVHGDITLSGHSKTPQRPAEEFGELLLPVINHPLVEGVRWEQYTPYFNDGDPCVFRIGEAYFRLQGMSEEAGDYEDGWESIGYANDPVAIAALGERRYEYKDGKRRVWFDPEGSEPELAAALQALGSALGSGAFKDALLVAFGDHATVTATRDGFNVEYYEHD